MRIPRRTALIAASAIVLASGGVAIAASTFTSPQQERQAVIDDAAKRLSVKPADLSNALMQAMLDRVDQAVTDGRITKAQGDALKARLQQDGVPLGPMGFGGPGGFRHGGDGPGFGRHGGPGRGGNVMGAAATYLGVTEEALDAELDGGSTLAKAATAHNKTVDGLKKALTDGITKDLDQAVTDGRITKAQETGMLTRFTANLDALVNAQHHGGGGWGGGPGDGDGSRTPPAGGSGSFDGGSLPPLAAA